MQKVATPEIKKLTEAEWRLAMRGLQHIAKSAATERERDEALAALVKMQHASGETLGPMQFGK